MLPRSGLAALGLSFAFAIGAPPARSEVRALAQLQSVFGKDEVQLRNSQGSKPVKAGKGLIAGDTIVTGPDSSAVILYVDGSTLSVARSTEFKIEDQDQGSQWNRLRKGEVRANVSKAQGTELKKPRFIIRTKSMTMGVRGTEFVLGADAAGTAKLHTLEGSVEAATNELSLLSGKGQSVAAGNMISADKSGLRPQADFDVDAFKSQIERNYLAPASEGSGASGAGSGVTAASSGAGGAGSAPPPTTAASSAASTAAPRIQAPPPAQVSAPSPAEAAKAEADPKDKPKDDGEPRKKPRKIRLIAGQVGGIYGIFKTKERRFYPHELHPDGGFYGPDGQAETYFTSFVFSYTPSVPVPFVPFLYLRGQASILIFKNGFASDRFLIHEYGGFVGMDLLKPIYLEAGWGRQIFRTRDMSSVFFALYGGFILNEDGFFNRLFLGRTELDAGPTRVEEYTAGIGVQF